MKIKCDCGKVICEGETKIVETKRGKRKRYYMGGEINGEIHKNKSNNPNDWTGICSDCQKNEPIKK